MKLIYLAVRKDPLDSGVNKKILNATRIWRELGVEALACVCTSGASVLGKSDYLDQDIRVVRFNKYNPLKQSLQSRSLNRWVREQNIDLIYFRYNMFPVGLGSLFEEFPTVVEVNSDDRAEIEKMRSFNPIRSSVLNEITRRRIFSRAKGIVSVSSEIIEKPYFDQLSLPTVSIGNGADLKRIPSLPPARGKRARFVFMGSNEAHWYGIDKLKDAAAALPEFEFLLIGNFKKSGRVPVNVTFTGPLSGEALIRGVTECDIGIGTLALHRNGMNEASPLKVRDYLAWGLPVIIGYEDSDFPGEEDFILKLPNHESNVVDSIEQIREFAKRWKGKRVPRDRVKAIDSVEKEKKRIAFFERILKENRKGC